MKRIAVWALVLMLVFCGVSCAESTMVRGETFAWMVPDTWEQIESESGWTYDNYEYGARYTIQEQTIAGFSADGDKFTKEILAEFAGVSASDLDVTEVSCPAGIGIYCTKPAMVDDITCLDACFGIYNGDTLALIAGRWRESDDSFKEYESVLQSVSLANMPEQTIADFAQIDFGGMSLAELIEARQQIQQAMWETDEWQSVEVPPGIYKIGEDIPAGHWTITGTACLSLFWGKGVDEYGVDLTDTIDFLILDEGESVSWELVDGTYIKIGTMPAVFTPYIGKPDLGFK